MDQAQQLRELMRTDKQKSLARVITITSGKGGVGKSSISVNLALELAKLGKRVVILDADFGLANVEVMLGIRPTSNLADLMFRGKSLSDIITQGPMGIGFISGGSGIHELNNLTPDQIEMMTQRLYELDELADIVIVDTGAGISNIVLQFVAASSEVLLVATPEPTSITDAYALIKALNRQQERMTETTVRLIANRVTNSQEGQELYIKLNSVVQRFLDIKLEYMGAVVQDHNVVRAIMQQKPVSVLYPNSPSSKSILSIAESICDENNELTQKQKGITRIFTGIIKSSMFGRKGEVKNGV